MKTAYEIIQELTVPVGMWAAHNFDFHAPHYGVAEEAGELIHALLKSGQGIRGTPEEHRAKQIDALADIQVFAAHLRYKCIAHEPVDGVYPGDLVLGALFMAVGRLLQTPRDTERLDIVCEQVQIIADALGVDLEIETKRVWAEVSKRDWRRFPKNGLTE